MRGRSPRRARRGGHLEDDPAEAVVEVLAELAALDHRAAGRGASRRRCGRCARMGVVPPTRSKVRSWSTRSSATWVRGEMSPISSRKRVPPSASSKRPRRRAVAPVNAPFSCPNSSRQEERLDQRRAVDRRRAGPPARSLAAWMRLGDELLAGAALAANEHGAVRARDLLDRGEEAPDGRVVADDVARLARRLRRGRASGLRPGGGMAPGPSAEADRWGRRVARRASLGEHGVQLPEGDEIRPRHEGDPDVARQRRRDLIAQGHSVLDVRARRLDAPGAAMDLAEQRVRLDDEVLLAARAGRAERLDRGRLTLVAAGACVEPRDDRPLGASLVRIGERPPALEELRHPREIAVLERDARRDPVRLAQELARARGLALGERAVRFVSRLDGVAPKERVAGRLKREARGLRGRHARSESAAAEGYGVLGVVEEAQPAAKLGQVAEDTRGRQAVADSLAQLQGALGERERLGILVAERRQHREVVERERDGARVALALALAEHPLEDAPRLLDAPLGQQGDAAIEARAELFGAEAGGRRRPLVFREVDLRLVPGRVGQEQLAQRVARLEPHRNAIVERQGARRLARGGSPGRRRGMRFRPAPPR